MSYTYNLQDLNDPDILEKALQEATGPIAYNMTNDYMFRAVLQSNESVLRKFICSLLHYQPEEIHSIEIKNPIKLGETMDAKDFILDIHIILNNNMSVNLEMQVLNLHNWPERSLCYLCRNFDSLNKGESYRDVKPAMHIGILDFEPFDDREPEFYSHYKMMNVKNQHVYSDKFSLSVLSLKHIERATEDDILWQLDLWATLFKMKTWEDLRMLAEKNPEFLEFTKEVFKQNADETIRDQCRARAEAEAYLREVTNENDKMAIELKYLMSEREELTSANEQLTARLDSATGQLAAAQAEIEALKQALLKLNE